MVGCGVLVFRTGYRLRRAAKRSIPPVVVRPAVAPATVDQPAEDTLTPVQKYERYVKDRGGTRACRKILVANNGMAATKAILSMSQWAYLDLGLEGVFEFVVMATKDDLDANAEFIRLADIFIEVPAGKNVNNYANVDLICEVAQQQGVDAVWPGWGHASENPKLPERLKEMGITFIGPSSPVMSVLGDKIAANILAQTAGVSSIPWSGDGLEANLQEDGTIPQEIFKKGTLNSAEEALTCAERIGFPVMLKASEGGGGKGIRMCNSKEELVAAYPQVIAEAPPGSPVFMMQLCQGARHIEVQIIGDTHGHAVALNGRDCSTQRRFQKIFEEGPPIVVPKDTFREMERAAQRLTQNLGYVGAGTVEYLYNAKTDEYFFLELNPRLQVEHPVTEEICGVNLPSVQLQVCMGIPLENIPSIRKFYGKSPDDTSSGIDFMKEDYVYPTKHVIASRITAENPDDGFKPTSGRIQRIKFQSSVTCWGYFSVGANGNVHEYADSQFGHIFAHGPTREEARKSLMLSLKNIDVVGDIRTPVEYLVELLEMDAFKSNTLDTSWLDGLIREKSVSVAYDTYDVVFYAAVFRAMEAIKERERELLGALEKSQLGPLNSIGSMNTFPVEIAFEGVKYNFEVERVGPQTLIFAIGGDRFEARVRTQTDGSIFVSVGCNTMTVYGTEEPLGLRLRLEGVATVVLPTLYDPSELRSEFNGKVVRFLQEPGGKVKAGEPYVELEAMKMIMPVKAAATGKISHVKPAGSIVAAGDLLGTLELDDPSSVVKIVPFDGEFKLSAALEIEEEPTLDELRQQVELALDGYAPAAGPRTLVQELFVKAPGPEQNELRRSILTRYMAVEKRFADLYKEGISSDQIYLTLIGQSKDNLSEVVDLCLAHSQLQVRNEIVLATMRTVPSGAGDIKGLFEDLLHLPSEGGYGEVALLARQYSQMVSGDPFATRAEELRKMLLADDCDVDAVSSLKAVNGGVELLASHFGDDEPLARSRALEVFVRRTYRGFEVSELTVEDAGPSQLHCIWKFSYPGSEPSTTTMRGGSCKVVPKLGDILSTLAGDLPFDSLAEDTAEAKKLPNTLQVVVAPDAFPSLKDRTSVLSSERDFLAVFPEVTETLQKMNDKLRAAGVREFVIMCQQAPQIPRYASFTAAMDWAEDKLRRDMRPTFAHLMEVNNLAEEYDLERIIPTIGRNSQVYLGVQKGVEARGRFGKPSTTFVRMITHTIEVDDGEKWMEGPEYILQSAIDEIERARLSPKVGQKPTSHIYVNFMKSVELSSVKLAERMEHLVNHFVSRYGSRLQKSKVDEIVLKVGVGGGVHRTLRMTASSMTGEYLKTNPLLEKHDPITGLPTEWFDIQTGESRDLSDAASRLKIQMRRAAARAAGSTYAPEFLGMLKIELIKRWNRIKETVSTGPDDVFESRELVLNGGELIESDRIPGSNDIGMVAWRCTMQTPEYPKGRDVVVIANDITHQAGSFGVKEDLFFQKASQYCREQGLPRIYIACNSGARVGLVEELKPVVKVKWVDANDPAKGFDYLYLTEADYKNFDDGVVDAHKVNAGGETHYVIDSIIGQGLKSTAGGIGVENLRGSGLIAGETSRAYDEVFTLSYVTGRSVGIGAYLNRLGQRVIQMVNGPMILTGFGALNKLLGKKVYTSQDQLGGPQVMVPNGITHQLVQSDSEGVSAILDWLSYVPKDVSSPVPIIDAVDPPSRRITFTPTSAPYDPRHMLGGTTLPDGTTLSGFFDEGTFREYLGGWAKSVIVGRGKLGGIPMGCIAVETRLMERRIPADPANPESKEVVEAQAGQVWFPDSAYKTATAIRDFNRGENLPLIIFANWRGFSGGTRDMYQEVLKFGSQIVDALVEYRQPVFIYIPPFGELRGGSWVVVDPTINPDYMEMYADVQSRGGILEPAGIVEVKFRSPQQVQLMHRLDPKLKALDAQLEEDSSTALLASTEDTNAQIAQREQLLAPIYTQIACEFADLHDRAGRMKAQGVITDSLEWASSREFFYWRVKRRVQEEAIVKQIRAADERLSAAAAKELLTEWVGAAGNDREVLAAFESLDVSEKVKELQVEALVAKIKDAYEQLPKDARSGLDL